jgi:XapX domain-containing protein
MRLILGFELAFAIGAVCRLARIPSPAPNALLGSLLVVAMSVGYIAAGGGGPHGGGAISPPANSFFS